MEEQLSFGHWVKRRRKALDLTQAELARRVGCAEGTLRRLEADEMRPSKQLAELLAERLEVAPADRAAFVRFARMQPGADSLPLPSLDAAFPTSTAREGHAPRLPAQLTPFIGREQELAEIGRLLADPACRLLTLIGPGGIGKTRLAVRAAGAAGEAYRDGVYFAGLAPVGAVEHLVAAIANALQVKLEGPADTKDQLLAYLRHRELLLVLDNFDQLLEGAGLLSEVLTRAPRVKLLVTSRERLHLQEEWVLELWGLHYPQSDVEDFLRYSAVQLFLQTAHRVQPGAAQTTDKAETASMTRICRLVGGMPLALELAAGWVRTLSYSEIAHEIERSLSFLAAPVRNLPQRHHSIETVFDHSWKLLSPQEQDVFTKLSVFRGGFGREAAEQVAGATLSLLSALLDKSLVHRVATDRYDLHELIRQYTWQRLLESGELEAVRTRHLEFFIEMAEHAEPELRGAKAIACLDRLTLEHDNLRVALEWSLENPAGAELGLRLAGALGWFWHLRSHYGEGRAWLARTLAAEATLEGFAIRPRLAARAKALHWASTIAANLAERAGLARMSLDLGREIGDRRSQAYALTELGFAAQMRGDFEQARSLAEESLALFKELEDVPGTLHALMNPCATAIMEGDLRRAADAAHQLLAFARRVGDVDGAAAALSALGVVALYQGEYDLASRQFSESARLFSDVGNRAAGAMALQGLAGVALKQGNHEQARMLLRQYLILRRDELLADISPDNPIPTAISWLAELTSHDGREHGRPVQVLRAVRLLGAADAMYQAAHWPNLYMRAEHDQRVADLRRALDGAAFAAAWAEGRAMTPEQAIAYALEEP